MGDVALDPFDGSDTTPVVVEKLERQLAGNSPRGSVGGGDVRDAPCA